MLVSERRPLRSFIGIFGRQVTPSFRPAQSNTKRALALAGSYVVEFEIRVLRTNIHAAALGMEEMLRCRAMIP